MYGELNPSFHNYFDLGRKVSISFLELTEQKRTRFSILVFTQAQEFSKDYHYTYETEISPPSIGRSFKGYQLNFFNAVQQIIACLYYESVENLSFYKSPSKRSITIMPLIQFDKPIILSFGTS